jgi:sugar porter (SP) family MFS transporter
VPGVLPDAPRAPIHDSPGSAPFRWASAAALGSFLLGYHSGVLSGALLWVRDDFRLNSFEQGALVSLLPLGAMVGSIVAGRLADAVGRRRTLVLDAALLLIATGLTAVAPSYGVLMTGRVLAGFGVGVASSVVPVYLSELAPPGMRGRLVTVHQLQITVGILVAYVVNLIFAGSDSWRALFVVGLVPAAALLVGMLRSPETPAWLDARGRSDLARQVIRAVATSDETERLLEDIRRTRGLQQRRMSPAELVRRARPALVIGVTLAALQQLSGINAIIYYAPAVMEKTGLSSSASILASVIIGAINVAATVVSFRLVDRTGRRPLLLASLLGMVVSLVALGAAFHLSLGPAGSWLALISILVYITAFAVGLGPLFWLLVAEIFPADTRAAGMGVSTAMNWFSTFVVGLAFLPLVSVIGQGPTFWIFAAVCVLALLFVNRLVPETKGRTFVEIDAEVHQRWRRHAKPTAE